MLITDEIIIARAEYICMIGKEPTQVILPKDKYDALIKVAHDACVYHSEAKVNIGKFNGMKVYEYCGEMIVCS
jgi:hypothetical protein